MSPIFKVDAARYPYRRIMCPLHRGLKRCKKHPYNTRIFIDKRYFRPAEVDQLLGDASKAKTKLGWYPKISFDKLVMEMVEHDCKPNSS